MQPCFDPRELELLAKVVDTICAELPACDSVTKDLIARRVLLLASEGEKDFDKLVDLATSIQRAA